MRYENELGVTFDNKHTYRDYGFFPTSPFVVSPPSAKTNYVEIPNSDGSLDLTEALSDYLAYNDREYEQQFKYIGDRKRWPQLYSDFLNDVQGRLINIVSDEDLEYFWFGRVHADSVEHNGDHVYITLKGQFEPYKYEKYSSTDEWLWDEINFETSVIRDYSNISVNNETVVVVGSKKSIVPTIIVDESDDLVLKEFNGDILDEEMGIGQYVMPEIELHESENYFVFEGSGIISIDFRGASL